MKNINSRQYWDRIWSSEGYNTWRVYPECFSRITQHIRDFKVTGLNRPVILDVGCGMGILLKRIRFLFPEAALYGVDISPIAINYLRTDMKSIEASFSKVPPLDFADEYFDIVITTEFLEHFNYPEKVLSEIARVTKKYAIFAVPNNILGSDECKEHYQKFTIESLRDLLEKYFRFVRIEAFDDKFTSEGKNILLPTLLAVCLK